MAKGEQYEHIIKCDNCGRDGQLTVTEFDSKMVSVTDGFSYRDNVVSCTTCRINVFEIPQA